jgi:hypothetical protein
MDQGKLNLVKLEFYIKKYQLLFVFFFFFFLGGGGGGGEGATLMIMHSHESQIT